MFNQKNYWSLVYAKQAEIERDFAGKGVVYITSLHDELRGLHGGAVCETSLRLGTNKHGIAAKNIVDGTHRFSTPEEIAQFHVERDRRTAASAVMQSQINRGNSRQHLYIDREALTGLGEAI